MKKIIFPIVSLERGFILVLLVITFVVGLVGSNSSVSQSVLGACSVGSLTTSTNKVFQMAYPNETFLQLANIDLLKDVSQLKDLTCLQYLDATDRTIKGDIANLKNLTNLEVFSLYSNQEVFGDICSLAGATKLRVLKFAFDPKITGDISCLKNLTKLETFAMTHTQITGDLSVFANMPNLKDLYINGTNIKGDICALKNLTNLEELGIADEVGNPGITGDLSCLDNLQKLEKVSLYNTRTANCDGFTKRHPNIKEGGCSSQSQATLKNKNQKYERKIGKEEQMEVRKEPNYQQGVSFEGKPDNRNFITKFFDWLKSLFTGEKPEVPIKPDLKQGGPGGCKSQSECESFCSKKENREECSKFAPPGDSRDSEPRPEGPGGCKSADECDKYCSQQENQKECSKFAPPNKER